MIQEPVLFDKLNEQAKSQVAVTVEHRRRQLIQNCRPGINLANNTVEEIDRIYAKCTEEMTILARVKGKIARVIDFAQLPEEIKDTYTVESLKHTSNRARPFQISVAGDNLLMGYSMYDLLFSAEVISRGDLYKGEQTFNINRESLNKLDNYLTELLKWKEDFTQIVGDLLVSDEPENYITTGQKRTAEILLNPINMDVNVVARLRALPADGICLLLNQVSLNLVNHPKKNFIKEKIEGFYALENMTSANGLPKRFLVMEPFRTNINAAQLKKICPRLNRLLKFQQLVRDFTGAPSLEDGIAILKSEAFGYENELEVMKNYKAQILLATYRAVLGNRTDQNQLQMIVGNLGSVISSAPESIDLLEEKSKELCEDLLRDHTGVFFKRVEDAFIPSAQQINDLYGGERMENQWGNNRNLGRLFATLKNCPEVRTILGAHPEYVPNLDQLQSILTRRNGSADLAIEHFEHYVANIVYRSQSHVSVESIEASMIQMFSNDWQQVAGACNTGLDGRILNLLTTLATSVGADLQSNLVQFQRECLDLAFNRVAAGNPGENSMYAQGRGEASGFLGLTPTAHRRDYGGFQACGTQQIVDNFFNAQYTPVAVYHKARSFFSDRFWQLNQENTDENNESIYELFTSLGFPGTREELDRKYRVNGDPEKGWQYAYFQQDLPQYLVAFLIRERILITKGQDQTGVIFQKEGQQAVRVGAPVQPNYFGNNFQPTNMFNAINLGNNNLFGNNNNAAFGNNFGLGNTRINIRTNGTTRTFEQLMADNARLLNNITSNQPTYQNT